MPRDPRSTRASAWAPAPTAPVRGSVAGAHQPVYPWPPGSAAVPRPDHSRCSGASTRGTRGQGRRTSCAPDGAQPVFLSPGGDAAHAWLGGFMRKLSQSPGSSRRVHESVTAAHRPMGDAEGQRPGAGQGRLGRDVAERRGRATGADVRCVRGVLPRDPCGHQQTAEDRPGEAASAWSRAARGAPASAPRCDRTSLGRAFKTRRKQDGVSY